MNTKQISQHRAQAAAAIQNRRQPIIITPIPKTITGVPSILMISFPVASLCSSDTQIQTIAMIRQKQTLATAQQPLSFTFRVVASVALLSSFAPFSPRSISYSLLIVAAFILWCVYYHYEGWKSILCISTE